MLAIDKPRNWGSNTSFLITIDILNTARTAFRQISKFIDIDFVQVAAQDLI